MELGILILFGIGIIIYNIISFVKNKYYKINIKNKLSSLEGTENEYPFLLEIVKSTKNDKNTLLQLFGRNIEITWNYIGKNIKIENGRIKKLKLDELYLKDNENGYKLFELAKNLIRTKKLECLIGFQVLSNQSKYLKQKEIYGNLYFGEKVTNLGNIEIIKANNYGDVFSSDNEYSFFDDFSEELHYDIAKKIINGNLNIEVEDKDGNLEFHIKTKNSKLLELETIPGDLYIYELKDDLDSLGNIKEIKGDLILDDISSISLFNLANFILNNNIKYNGIIDFEMDKEGILFQLEKIPGNLGIYIDKNNLNTEQLKKFKNNYQNIKIKEISGILRYNEDTNYGEIIKELLNTGKLKAKEVETYSDYD